MTKYADFIALGAELIGEFGFNAELHHVSVGTNPAAPYLTQEPVDAIKTPIQAVSFPNDGVTFVTENVSINSRIFLISPRVGASIAKGDAIYYNNKRVEVLDFKIINPDESEDVLWSVLVS